MFSDNAQRIAFVSQAGNLVTNGPLRDSLQIFVRDLAASNAVLVSIATNGQTGSGDSFAPMFSSNGQFVVFVSEAGYLSSNDSNEAHDVFVRDLNSGVTRLVSADFFGRAPTENNRSSGNPIISADGRWVFFESLANGFTYEIFTDGNGGNDLYVRDLQFNTNALITRSLAAPQTANAPSALQSISADGRFVTFISGATDLVPGVSNISPWTIRDVFARDMVSNKMVHVSSSLTNFPYGYICQSAVMSESGRFVAFTVLGPTINSLLLYRRDLETPAPALVASSITWGSNSAPQISADGRYVAYADGTNVWRFDANNGTNELVNVTTNGAPPVSGASRQPVMTPDGNGIVFISNSPEITTNNSSRFQIYARDMAAGVTRLITAATNGQASAGSHEFSLPTVARDFSRVAFDSVATDLVMGDGNRATDVFVRNLASETTTLLSQRHAALPHESGMAQAFVFRDCLSADGRFVAFSSYDNDVLPGDTNGRPDVFVRDILTGATVTPGFSTNAARSPAISASGRYVIYLRREVVSPAVTSGGAVWRFDRQTGMNELISTNSSSARPAISPDGQVVAFLSGGALRLRDMAQPTNETIAVAEAAQGRDARFTPDGRFVLFVSAAALVPNVGGYPRNLYACDRVQRTIQLVSQIDNQDVGVSGSFAVSGNSRAVACNDYYSSRILLRDLVAGTNQVLRFNAITPALNGDGSLVVFSESIFRLLTLDLRTGQESVVADADGGRYNAPLLSADGRFVIYGKRSYTGDAAHVTYGFQLYVRDRLLGTTLLVTPGLAGMNANGAVWNAVLADDGRTVAFHSAASDLVAGDYNDKLDVFALKLGGADTDGDGMDDDWEVAYFGNLSRHGTGDFDNDGVSDKAEFLAGTDPTNANSVFRVLTLAPAGGGGKLLLWAGNPARNYRAEFKDDLGAASWTALSGAISWNGSTASIPDPNAGSATNRYYRVVRLP